jgi:hypothetical protein
MKQGPVACGMHLHIIMRFWNLACRGPFDSGPGHYCGLSIIFLSFIQEASRYTPRASRGESFPGGCLMNLLPDCNILR